MYNLYIIYIIFANELFIKINQFKFLYIYFNILVIIIWKVYQWIK